MTTSLSLLVTQRLRAAGVEPEDLAPQPLAGFEAAPGPQMVLPFLRPTPQPDAVMVRFKALNRVFRGDTREVTDGRRHLRLVHDRALPRTRAECVDGPRPCPYVSCRHHLLLDVSADGGSLQVNYPEALVDEEPDLDKLVESCSLDVAARVAEGGGASHEEIGNLLRVSRERARQIEGEALRRLRRMAKRRLET